MIIPYEQLDKDTLYNLIESYVLREGTDYGEVEASIESKVNQVKLQLKVVKLWYFSQNYMSR